MRTALVITLFIALLGGVAQAGSVTWTADVLENYHTGPGGPGTGENLYDWSGDVPGFDPSMGVLTSVEIAMSGTLDLLLTGGIDESNVVDATISLQFGSNFSLEVDPPAGPRATLASAITPILSIDAVIPNGGSVMTSGSRDLTASLTATGANVLPFIGASSFVRLYWQDLLRGAASGTYNYDTGIPINPNDPSRGNIIENRPIPDDTWIWAVDHDVAGAATVTYNYRPPSSSVPLPTAAWAGLAVLGALGAIRRVRRR